MRAFGLFAEAGAMQSSGFEFELWPEHAPVMAVWLAMTTQWNILSGMNGVIYQGLDYGVLPTVLRLLGAPRRDWPEMFVDLRTMESAALPVLNDRTPH